MFSLPVLLPTPTVYFTKTEYIFRMKNADDIQREGKGNADGCSTCTMVACNFDIKSIVLLGS